MKKPEALGYRELINVDGHSKSPLLPNYIPLQPSVWESDFAFAPGFLSEVRKSIPDSLINDISAIEEVLGADLGLSVSNEGILEKSRVSGIKDKLFEFDGIFGFSHECNPVEKTVDVGWCSSNIAMLGKRPEGAPIPPISCISTCAIDDCAISPEKICQYSMREEGLYPDSEYVRIIRWYAHNVYDAQLPVQLYFRNFAIQFNNLGLEKL